ncbi:hypothetical protein BS78_06G234300 [Paspalum vaginatum]|nr:hypothetical protein BS78_06G234300 [Paspalum vaginatum]
MTKVDDTLNSASSLPLPTDKKRHLGQQWASSVWQGSVQLQKHGQHRIHTCLVGHQSILPLFSCCQMVAEPDDNYLVASVHISYW